MSDFDSDDRREAVAQFRAEIIGHLLRRDLPRGALSCAFDELSEGRYRPPGADKTRTYAASTLERWYYAYKNDGLEALAREHAPTADTPRCCRTRCASFSSTSAGSIQKPRCH